jgi:formylmethanofuran dehydrogenase subunit E
MFDIFFDSPADQISILYDELALVSAAQNTRVLDEETEIESESISFNFELDLPEGMLPDDDYPVIIKESGKCAPNSKKKYINGATCSHCNEIYPYAEESNQKDGSFKCYSCRKYG